MTTPWIEGGLTRRDALKGMLAGAAGLALADPLTAPAWGAAAPLPTRARSVIQIWMWGGPSHIDTFDPKPKAGYDYCGALDKVIDTNVDGIQIGAPLEMLARQADKYSIIRSMTHGVNGHETASYMVQTGRKTGRVVYPSVGAVVSLFKGHDGGYEGIVPPYIVLTESASVTNRSRPAATRTARRSLLRVSSPRASRTSGSAAGATCCTNWTHSAKPCPSIPTSRNSTAPRRRRTT